MTKVNLWYLGALLSPIAGYADFEESVLDVNESGSPATISLIRSQVVPYYHSWSCQDRAACKDALKYALLTDENRVESLMEMQFDRCLTNINASNVAEVRRFYYWIWKELFPDEEPDAEGLDSADFVNQMIDIQFFSKN